MPVKASASSSRLASPVKRRFKGRLITAVMLVTVVLWAWFQQSMKPASGNIISSGGGAVGGGSSRSGSRSPLLRSIDDTHTLQFDVCNGFTNQRIALMSGLVLAADTNRSVVLPDWLLRGYMPDAVEYVTADDGNSVPFSSWFDEEVFVEALAAHGVSVAASKAPEPWSVSIKGYDSQAKPNAIISFLRKKRPRQHIKINCPAFRLPGALMGRHEAMLRAASEALRPSPHYQGLIDARRAELAEKAGTGGDKYNLLHLRVEKDWLALCEWWQNPAKGRDNCMNNTATVGKQLRKKGFEREVPVLVVTSFPDAVPDALNATLKNIRDNKYQAVLGNELTLDAKLEREESALLDYYLGLQADKFIGNSVSTFTAFVILERQWQGRSAFWYNGGSIPLELFFPFYQKPVENTDQ